MPYAEFSSSGQVQHRDRILLTFLLKQDRAAGRRLGGLLKRKSLGSADPLDNSRATLNLDTIGIEGLLRRPMNELQN
jgi:hypothetical protein